MKPQYDIYRLNPESPYRTAAFLMREWEMAFRPESEDDASGKINWEQMSQNDRDFYDLLSNDPRALFDQIYKKPEITELIMADMPQMAQFFGHFHPVIHVRTYRASPPRAYEVFPSVELPQADFDEIIFPEHKSFTNYLATLPKGETLMVNDIPHFVYILCPQNYDGTEGFVPEDAVRLTPEQVKAYHKRCGEMVGDGFGEGPYSTINKPMNGVPLPLDFDVEQHQHVEHIIFGEAHMETVTERWDACNKEDALHCVPLPPFPKEWLAKQ